MKAIVSFNYSTFKLLVPIEKLSKFLGDLGDLQLVEQGWLEKGGAVTFFSDPKPEIMLVDESKILTKEEYERMRGEQG